MDDGASTSKAPARRSIQPQIPGRPSGIVPSRGPVPPRQDIPPPIKSNGVGEEEKQSVKAANGVYTLRGSSLDTTLKIITAAIQAVGSGDRGSKDSQSETTTKKRNVILILDTPDIISACLGDVAPSIASGVSMQADQITPQALTAAILELRAQVHSTVITVSADDALLNHPAHSYLSHSDFGATPTPLEANQTHLILGLAHNADLLLQCRPLDTGTAGDVSGVLRAGLGDGAVDQLDTDGESGLKEGEWLYYVQSDGGARVFERGSEAQGGE
jgi:elongator complex protein 6